MNNYINAARTMEDMMLELMEQGFAVPEHVLEDLKTGRTLARIAQRLPEEDEDDAGTIQRALFALQNVEMNLLSLAEMLVGLEYAENWQKKIADAFSREGEDEEEAIATVTASKFLQGVPKSEHWVRIKASELEGITNLNELLDRFMLTAKQQDDGFILIYGKKEVVSEFLKEVRRIAGKMGS
ncbi:MAG: DUF2096 domain-containing protein [Eubacteriaceae bacterium]|nr:DUF2096 domain-containing protein [Eubacteriaceae bacterium]